MLDKLVKKGESAWKSTKDAAASVASKTGKMTNTLADKTSSAVIGAAEATKQTTTSIIDDSSKLAKTTAEKSSDLAGKAWEGIRNVKIYRFPPFCSTIRLFWRFYSRMGEDHMVML